MSIKVGDPAPDFTLVTKTATGPALVKLSEEISKSNVVLLFVPMAFTGVCTTELCDVSNGISAYE
ncbi:MAG: redoxin family protein, partial [bacterium]